MLSLVTPQFANEILDLYLLSKTVESKDKTTVGIAKRLYDDESWSYKVSDLLHAIAAWYESPAHMLEAVANVLTFGAAKYERHNWKRCEEDWRYEDAAHRHALALLKGEEKDEESGLHHMDHILCNLMFLEYLS